MKCSNVHISPLDILVLTISINQDKKQTHFLTDCKYLLAFFWFCSVFNITNLLLEAFSLLVSK